MNRKPLIPRYAVLPLAAALIFNLLVYYATKPFSVDWPHHYLASRLDDAIPLCPVFLSIYGLAFVQWVVGYVMAARESRELCGRMVAGDIVAKLLCLVCFLVFPTTMVRPDVPGSGLWDVLLRMVYAVDTPTNLFPSIHCLECWVCSRAALRMKTAGRWYKVGMTMFTVLVFASTLLVKQHVLADVVGGVAAAELGIAAEQILQLHELPARAGKFLRSRAATRQSR